MGKWSNALKQSSSKWSEKLTAPSAELPPGVEMLETREGDTIPVFRSKKLPETNTLTGVGLHGGMIGKILDRNELGVEPPAGEGKGVGLGTLMSVGGQSPDPELRKRTFAASRGRVVSDNAMAGKTLEEIRGMQGRGRAGGVLGSNAKPGTGEDLSKYRTLPDGEIVRLGDDGVWYSETPSMAKNMAAAALNPRSVATALVGTGALMTGPVKGPALAAAVEAGSEALERKYAREKLGEKGSKTEAYVIRPLVRGAVAGTTGLTATLGSKGVVVGGNKILRGGGRTGYPGRLVKASEEINPAEMIARTKKAASFDIDLNAPQATRSPILKAVHGKLSESAYPHGARLRAAGAEQMGKLEQRIIGGEAYGIPKFVTEAEVDSSGKAIADAARKYIGEKGAGGGYTGGLKKLRGVRTKPFYDAAKREVEAAGGIDISKTLAKIDDNIKNAATESDRTLWKSIRKDMFETEKMKLPNGKSVPSLQSKFDNVDRIYKTMGDRQHSMAAEKGWKAANINRDVKEIRQWLMDDIKSVAPSYEEGGRLWGLYSRAIRKFTGDTKKTFMGKAAEASTPQEYAALGKELLSKDMPPKEIGRIRAQTLSKLGQGQEAWDKMIRGGMADVVQDTLSSGKGIPKWKLDRLKRAAPDMYDRILELNELVKDTLWATPKSMSGSAGEEILRREIPGVATKTLRKATPSPYIWYRNLEESAIRKASPEIAEQLATEEGMAKLMRLKQMKPGTEKRLAVLAYLGLQGVGGRIAERKVLK